MPKSPNTGTISVELNMCLWNVFGNYQNIRIWTIGSSCFELLDYQKLVYRTGGTRKTLLGCLLWAISCPCSSDCTSTLNYFSNGYILCSIHRFDYYPAFLVLFLLVKTHIYSVNCFGTMRLIGILISDKRTCRTFSHWMKNSNYHTVEYWNKKVFKKIIACPALPLKV